jgi:O-antigen/teichoic acid export membrane protein
VSEVPADVDQRRILVNTFYLTIADVGSKVASIALYVVMARKLGDEKFGVFTLAFSVATLTTTFGGFGQATVLTREVARDRGKVHGYFANTLALMLGLTVPALVVVTVGLGVAGTDGETRSAIALLGVGVIADLLGAACNATFQAFERLGAIPAIQIPQRVVTAAAGIAALRLGAGVTAVSALYAATAVLSFIAGFAVVRRMARPSLRVEPRRWPSLMKTAAPIGMAAVFFTVLFRLDMVLLGSVQSRSAVGAYGAAYRILDATLFLTWAVTGAFYPVFSRLGRFSDPPMRAVFERSLKLVTSLTLPLAVGAAVLAGPLIHLVYGPDFGAAARALLLLAPTIALYPPAYLAAFVLVSQDRQRVITWTYGLVALVNLALNLVLIPRWSLNGAALATSMTQVLLAAALLVLAQRQVGRLRWAATLATPAAAAGLAALTMHLAGGGVARAGAAGSAVYLAVLVGVERAFFPEDFKALVGDVRGPSPRA